MGLLFIVVAIATTISVDALNGRVAEVADEHLPRMQHAQLIVDRVNQVARALRNAILSHDAAEIQRELDRIPEAAKDTTAALQKLESTLTSAEARAVLKAVQDARSAHLEAQARVVALIRDKKPEEARQLLVGEVRKSQSAYFDALQKLTTFEADLAHEASGQAQSRAGSTILFVIALAVVAFVAGAVVAVLVARSIVRPLGEAVAATQSVAKGDLTARVQVRSGDEIGQLCAALNDMVASLAPTVGDVREGSEQVAAAASEPSAASNQISASSQSQSESASATASAIGEITVSIGVVAESSEELRRMSENSLGQTRSGNAAVTQLAEEMERV
jgi:methyl-accepting chemotaxis protein